VVKKWHCTNASQCKCQYICKGLCCGSFVKSTVFGVQARHSWVFTMVDQNPDSNDYQLSHVFEGLDKDSALKKMKDAKGWLQSLPLFKRPLVKTSAQVQSCIAVSKQATT